MKPLTLVTGASGFVGKHVLAALASQQIPTRVIVRKGRADASWPTNTVQSVIETEDLFAEKPSWWANVCRGVDNVIHLAWYAEPDKYLTSPVNLECLAGTCAFASGAIAARVRRFTGIGTCLEYDVSRGLLDTATPLKPLTPYAAAKAGAFLALSEAFREANVAFAWCRLFHLYGEGEDPRRLLSYVYRQIAAGEQVQLSAGTQIRDYLDVTVAARRIVEVALGPDEGAVNICSGVPVTIRQFVESLVTCPNQRRLLRFGARKANPNDPPSVVGVPTRTADLGETPVRS